MYFHPVGFFFVLLLSSSFLLLFFPRLISAVADWMSATWCGLSVNLGCRSETCCTRLAENTGRTKVAKNRHGHHHTTLSGYIFATKALIDNRKKSLLSSNMSSRCPHNIVNFGALAAEIGLPVWGTHANFNEFRTAL